MPLLQKPLEFVKSGARQQGTMHAFMRSRLQELRGSSPTLSADDGSARGPRRRLLADIYEELRRTQSPGGLAAEAIALAIVEADGKGAASRTDVAVEQLEPWVDAALHALEETGHAYRAGIDERFLVSISDRRLDEKDLDDLLRSAFSSSVLWTIAALEEVRQGNAQSRGEGGAGRADGQADCLLERVPSASSAAGDAGNGSRKRTAIGALTQVYTTTHEIRKKHEAEAAPRACLWGWKGGRSPHQYVGVGRECTGRLAAGAAHRLWCAALKYTSKAVMCSSTMGLTPRPQHGSGPWPTCMEYSASGEYVLCARTDGNLTVFRSSSISHRTRSTWDEAAAIAALAPVRDVRGGLRSVDCAHWNPANRNELATSSRQSGDVHIFDMKVCGITLTRGPQHLQTLSRNTPTTIFSQRQAQANGSVLDFAFVPGAQSLMVAGTSKGAVVVWDARNPKTNKGVLKQEDGGVCYLRVLRDGYSVVAGTTHGAVHVWDIRAARASMAVMSIGGRNPDKPIFSSHLQKQLPLLNADSDVVPGCVAATTDDSHLRSYALDPVHEVDMAFAFGHRTVGVVNLLSGAFCQSLLLLLSLPCFVLWNAYNCLVGPIQF